MSRALLVFVPGVLVAIVTRLGLSWDGAYFVVDLLDQGHPVMLHRRPTMMLLQIPAWLASYLTGNTRVIGLLFAMPYVVMPLVVLWLSWLVVRRHRPDLMVWPALGIGLITLPGQAFFVSESVIVAQYVWPLALALITGYRWNRWAFGALVVLLFCFHPMTALVFGTVALVALIVGWSRPGDRTWAWHQGAALFGIGVARQLLTSLRVDSEVPKRSDIVAQWRHAVHGTPLLVVLLTWMAAAALLVSWRRARVGAAGAAGSPAVLGWTGLALLVASGALMTRWAFRVRSWAYALDYRSFVVLFALPVLACALLDGLRAEPSPGLAAEPPTGRSGPPRVLVVTLMGALFSLVLLGQGLGWRRLVNRLDRAVDRSPAACVEERTLPERHTALRHWATPALALLEQGRSPHRVVVAEPAACRRLVEKGLLSMPRTARLRNPVRNWFHFGRVRAAIRPQLPPVDQSTSATSTATTVPVR